MTIGQASKGRDNNFDFIRFVAASLVIYSHAFPLSAGNEGEILKDITNGQWSFGSLSVAIFFVISGFLISQSYDRKNEPLTFMKARILRIFPGLIVVILLSTFVLGPIVTTLPIGEYFRDPTTWEYLKNIFPFPLYWNLPGCFMNNFYSPSVNGSLWTIPFEIFFYCVVLILGTSGLLKAKKVSLAGYITFAVLETCKYNLFPVEGHIFGFPKYSFIELGLYYFAGMVLYAYREYITLDKHYAMISFAVLCVSIRLGQYTLPFSIFGSYLIMYFVFSKKLRLYNFAKYGDFSYGIYIYGFPVQQTVTYYHGGGMNPYVNMVISYPITVLLAIASWHCVEKPCMKLKKYGQWTARESIRNRFHKMQEKVRMICSIGWYRFAAIFCIAVVVINTYLHVPSVITFPYQNDSIFFERMALAIFNRRVSMGKQGERIEDRTTQRCRCICFGRVYPR